MQGLRRGMVLGALLALLFAIASAAPASAATVTVTRVGGGVVTSDPAGINCGSDCSQPYAGTESCEFDTELKEWICFTLYPTVTLTAGVAAGSGWQFDGWGGSCAGAAATCSLYPSSSKSVTATFVDIAKPTVSLGGPGPGIKSGSIVLGASASDNAAVGRVEFRVRGVLVATDTSSPYSATFNTASVADGGAEVRATAFDAAGNSGAATQVITIDNLTPELTLTAGPNDATLGSGDVAEWDFAASDAGSGLASVMCSVVPAEAADAFGACSAAQLHSAGPLADGGYRFAVRARDTAGRETTKTRAFAIDTTGPVIVIAAGPADGASFADTTVAFTFTANEPATFRCRVSPAALSPGDFVACTDTNSHVAAGFSPGSYAFELLATDAIGNLGPAVKRTFTVTASSAGGSGGSGGGPTGSPSLVDVGLAYKWAVLRGRTRVVAMRLKRLKAGMTVEVRCTGLGCPLKVQRPTVRRSTLGLARLFRRHKLRKAAVIEVHVSQPGFITKVFRYVTQKGSKTPKGGALCLPPGATASAAC